MNNNPITVSVKPLHLALGVGAIVIAIVALPIINSIYTSAYPPAGSVRRQMIDHCVENDGITSRWFSADVERCVAFQSVTGDFRKAKATAPVKIQREYKVVKDSPF